MGTRPSLLFSEPPGFSEAHTWPTTCVEPKGMKAGDLVAERWRIEREIGTGGMGIVYAATDLEADRTWR